MLSSINLAIVILNYKSCDMTIKLMHELNKLGYGKEIIVVDNNSGDNSLPRLEEEAKKNKCVVIANEANAGYAAGNNLGLKYAYKNGYEYALILNNDIEITEAAINSMRFVLDNTENAACVGTRVFLPDGREASQRINSENAFDFTLGIFAFEKKQKKLTKEKNGVFEIYSAPGCCMMLKLSDMNQIGYMDENTFLYFEESILSEKFKEIGKKCYCNGDAKIIHHHSVVTKKNLDKWSMAKIYAKSANYYLKEYRKFSFVKRWPCVLVKSMSMLRH